MPGIRQVPGKRIPVPYRANKSLSKVVPSRRTEEWEKGKRKEHDRRRVGRGPGWTSLNLALEEEEEEEEEEDRLV